jgi:hypothetical protein
MGNSIFVKSAKTIMLRMLKPSTDCGFHEWFRKKITCLLKRGRRVHDRMVVGFTTTYASSAYNHRSCDFETRSCEVYSIHHYMIKFVSDLRNVGGFLLALRFPPTKKTDRQDKLKYCWKAFKNFYRLPFSKWPPQYLKYSTLSDIIQIWYVRTLKLNNVEFVRYCGGHFENGNR